MKAELPARWKRPRFWIALTLYGVLLLLCVILLSYHLIRNFSAPYMTDKASQLPYAKVGVVLGTAKTMGDGRVNLYFRYRMEAAARLYHAKKVKTLLVSGNGVWPGDQETIDMRKALIKLGVPAQAILSDPKGVRTFDSVVRCHKIFKQNTFIVISQPFHNERAIFLARKKGLIAYGYNARKVRERALDIWREISREHLARVKAWLDLYVLGTKPHYLK